MARQPNAVPPKPNGHDPEIEVADIDAAPAPEVAVEPEHEAPVADPGIEELRRQLADASARASAAEQERDGLRNQRNRDQTEIADNRLMVIDSTITTKETEKTAIMSRLRDAKEAGDYDAETKAIDELTQINGDIRQATVGKARLEREIEEAKAAPADVDPFEASIANLPGEAQRWAREHKGDFTNPKRNALIQAAHFEAVADGIQPFTPDYFAKMEGKLGLRQVEEQATVEREAPQRESATPAAPVSRAAGIGGGGKSIARGITEVGPGKYRVSAEVAEAAAMSGITVAEYVEEAKKLVRGADGILN